VIEAGEADAVERQSIPVRRLRLSASGVRTGARSRSPGGHVLDRDRQFVRLLRHPADTIDPSGPARAAAEHTWRNVVAACARCNHARATAAERIGWHLLEPRPAPATGPVVLD